MDETKLPMEINDRKLQDVLGEQKSLWRSSIKASFYAA
jgi:hypothetical protein